MMENYGKIFSVHIYNRSFFIFLDQQGVQMTRNKIRLATFLVHRRISIQLVPRFLKTYILTSSRLSTRKF